MADKIFKTLSDQGWHITKEGYDLISDNGAETDLKVITKLLLDADIKDYGKAVLAPALNNSEINKVVLQIQKVKNISAPKSNQDSQAAPRMLKLILTDGHSHCQAVEIEYIPFLNHNKTPPGSKLLINKAVINSSYIALNESSCVFLGGNVQILYEKWEINKSIAKHNRVTCNGDGPPPWVSFGKKIQSSVNSQVFKSLDNKNKNKESSEFDVQRQDAIAEASTGAVKKVFGGGIKQIQNANQNKEKKPYNQKERINERKGKKELKNEEKLQKPPERVSLFEFLENKLPPNEELPTKVINESIDSKTNYSNKNSYEKQRHNQPKYTYPNQPNNWYHQNNYSANYQEQNLNSNYQQNRRNQFNYNQQPNYYSHQRNNQYKLPNQNDYNKIDEKQLAESFQQINVNEPSNINKKINEHDKVQNVSNSKYITEKGTDRISVNSEFASRSLRQHLNIKSDLPRKFNPETQPNQENRKIDSQENERQGLHTKMSSQIAWKIGDQCMAKYWEDNKFYKATITALTNRTCVVQFNDYGNFEEILNSDCLPLRNEPLDLNKKQSNSMEFRRGGNRSYNNNKQFGKPRY